MNIFRVIYEEFEIVTIIWDSVIDRYVFKLYGYIVRLVFVIFGYSWGWGVFFVCVIR